MNKNKTVAKVLATSSADIYVVPASFKSEVDSLVITNGSDSHVDVTVQWYEATSATTYDIADAIRMTPRSLIQITGAFYFDKNDKIVGSASVNSAVTVNVRAREYFAERL
jgi:hypothetical protein